MLKRRKLKRVISYYKITGLIDTKCAITKQAKGHMRILIDGKMYRLTNVIWALVHGELPEHGRVLQLNKNKLDFRLSNLYLDMSKAETIKKQDALSNKGDFFVGRGVDIDTLK